MSSDAPKPAKKRAVLINISPETSKMAAANAPQPEPVVAPEPKAAEPVAEAEKAPMVKKKSAKKALIRTIPQIKEARRILTSVTKKMGEILGVNTTRKKPEGISVEEIERRSRESAKKLYSTYDKIEERYSKLAAEQDDNEDWGFSSYSDGTTAANRKRKVSTETTPRKKPRTKQSATIALPVRTKVAQPVASAMSADAKRAKLMAFQQKFKNKYKFVSAQPQKTKAPRVKRVSKTKHPRQPKVKITAEQRKASAAEKRAIKKAAVLLARAKKLNP